MGCTSTKAGEIDTRAQNQPELKSKPEPDLKPNPDPPNVEFEKCPICLNSFTHPKTLQCNHVLCSRCLQRYINGLDNTAKLRGFPCPICRKLNIISNPDTPRQTWVEQIDEPETEPSSFANGNEVSPPRRLKRKAQVSNVVNSMLKGDDFEPMVVDIVVVSINNIAVVVVADFNNKSVKSLYKKNGKDGFSSRTLETNPFCMSLISDFTVALTLPWSDTICMVEVTPEIRVVKSVKTDKAYYGIAGIDEDCLAVSTTWQSPSSVDIIDHQGKVLKSIDRDHYGDDLFNDPWYLAGTPSGDIVVSDCQEQTLLCVDQSGNVKWRFKPISEPALKIPAGVACDKEGNIYLADTDRHHVIKMDEHGMFKRVVASRDDGVERPRCVAVSREGSLYVTQENGDIRTIALGEEY